MNKHLVIQLLCTAFCCFVSCFHLEAQFDSGATSLTEARLVDRAWHLSSKEDGNPLVRASGNNLFANDNSINAASTFVIDDGPNDNKWWTTDVRWFHIKSQSTGQYLTVPGNVPGIAVTLAPLIEGNVISSQQFRLVATLQEGWYKLRSRMGDLVIEVNSSGQLIVDSPKLDPSAEQKFAFNLALPTSSRYAIYSAGNHHFFSDNGVLAEGAPAVHIKNSNASIIWQFQAAGGGYYRIYNTLTKQYLALPSGGGPGSELIMTTSTGTNSHWELARNNSTFFIAHRSNTNLIINMNNFPASGNPLFCTVGGVAGREWILAPLPDEPDVVTGNYDRIADGELEITCGPFFGTIFKKGLIERVGLNPENIASHFAFIREAIAAEAGADKVDEMLIRFDLNNPGHRVDLVFMVRKYITEVLPLTSRQNWSPEANQAVTELEGKILAIRLDYAARINAAWEAYEAQYATESWGFSQLIDNIDASGFVWPGVYRLEGTQAGLIEEYTIAASSLDMRNTQIVGATFLGASVIVSTGGISGAITSAIFGAVAGGSTSAPTAAIASAVLSGAGPVITIATLAASAIAAKAMEVAELQQLLGEIADQEILASFPVYIDLIMSGNNLVDRIKLLNDLDYLMGAPVTNGFQFNDDDNVYLPPFSLSCNSTLTLSLDANGAATLTPAMCGFVSQLCGTEIQYYLSKSQFDCDDLGVNEVIFVAWNKVEEAGDSYVQRCTLAVNVVDEIAPTITCPFPQSLVLNANCNAALPDYQNITTFYDACGISTMSQSPAPGAGVSGAGDMTVTLTTTDVNNNSSECQLIVTKVDNTPPTVQCFTQTLTFNGETQFVLNADDLADASDHCGVAAITLSPSVITCAQLGQTLTVTATVTDISGNSTTCTSQVAVTGLPCGWIQNPGGVNCANGSSIAYNPVNGVWTATSTNCYSSNFNNDAAAFAQRTLCGDGSITAQVTSVSGAMGWAGIVMRENNDAGAKKAQLITNLSSLNRQEFRTATGGQAMPQQLASQNRFWLRIVRAGNQFSMFVSPNGQSWVFIGAQNIAMGACIQVGLVATNATANSTLTATFANVSFGSGGGNLAILPAGLAETAPVPVDFSVFPNPTSGEVTVDLSAYENRPVRLEVYDLMGKVLLVLETETMHKSLDLSAFQNGIYLIRVKAEGLPDATKRVVVR